MSGSLNLVYPVLAQVLLTFVLIVWNGQGRIRAVRLRRVRMRDIALSNEAWPVDLKQVENNMHNQYETPVLFYVLCGVATYVGATGVGMTVLAWAFVATRLAHTFIHTTTNNVLHRLSMFLTGLLVLFLMWLVIFIRIFGA
jgi:hypothetical protein